MTDAALHSQRRLQPRQEAQAATLTSKMRGYGWPGTGLAPALRLVFYTLLIPCQVRCVLRPDIVPIRNPKNSRCINRCTQFAFSF